MSTRAPKSSRAHLCVLVLAVLGCLAFGLWPSLEAASRYSQQYGIEGDSGPPAAGARFAASEPGPPEQVRETEKEREARDADVPRTH